MDGQARHRRAADLTRMSPEDSYTGVDAATLRALLDGEPARSVRLVDSDAVALVRPYARRDRERRP